MKIKVYLNLHQYEQWKRGEEVTVNNVSTEIGQMVVDPKMDVYKIKIEAYISEDEVLSINTTTVPDDYRRNVKYYEYTIKKKQ